MPDRRAHRGPHPRDPELFGLDQAPALREAVGHLSWLLTHGYAEPSSLKLVGDRFALTDRQRLAVKRCSCADGRRSARRGSEVAPETLAGAPIEIDGFNLLTTIEAALCGGVLLVGRDGCLRDMASMHGSYRKVAETVPALHLIGEFLAEYGVTNARWWLDRPVSNSGRLRTIMSDVAEERGWNWTIELAADPDPVLAASPGIVVTADSLILDQCGRWCSLARRIVKARLPGAWTLELGDAGPGLAD